MTEPQNHVIIDISIFLLSIRLSIFSQNFMHAHNTRNNARIKLLQIKKEAERNVA